MNVFPSALSFNVTRLNKVLWATALVLMSVAFAKMATAAGGGNALNDLNDWISGELGGSVGMAIALVSFFSGMIAAVAMRAFMPIVWGVGIGLVMGIFLTVVEGTLGAGLPIVNAAAPMLGL